MTDPFVRPYAPRDREAVRRLCFETGDAGATASRYFPDAELFADLWTLYFTDHEPDASWVVEEGGVVRGYLTACLDAGLFRRRMGYVGAQVLSGALRRGSLTRSWLWRLLAANAPLWFRGGGPRLPAGRSALFHINLALEMRGRGVGKLLIETFLAAARARGLSFVHGAIREDNAGTRRFFSRMGFQDLGTRPSFRTTGPSGREYAAALYIKTL